MGKITIYIPLNLIANNICSIEHDGDQIEVNRKFSRQIFKNPKTIEQLRDDLKPIFDKYRPVQKAAKQVLKKYKPDDEEKFDKEKG